MRVPIKPVKGEPFEVEVPAEATVADLKRIICETRPDMPAEHQKILYAGKVFADDSLVKDMTGIREGGRVVLMCTQPKAKTASESDQQAGARVAPNSSEPARPLAEESPAFAPPPREVTAVTDASVAVVPPAPEVPPCTAIGLEAAGELVDNEAADTLCAMGFDRADVENCLALAFGNPDRAAEYLINGIPPHLQRQNFALPGVGELPPPEGRARDLAGEIEAVSGGDLMQRSEAMRDLMENPLPAENPATDDPIARLLAAGRALRGDQPNATVWVINIEGTWQPWLPGVPFRGAAGETIHYSLGGHFYSSTFASGTAGVQTNLATSRTRQIRQVPAGRTPRPQSAPTPAIQPIPGICGHETLPPVMAHEVEFRIPRWSTYENGNAIRSDTYTVGDFTFRLLVFPRGTRSTQGCQISAFVEACVPEGSDDRWSWNAVKYQIALVNWIDYRCSIVKVDTWTFNKNGVDRGWHDMLSTEAATVEAGWVGPDDSLLLRASVICPNACSIAHTENYDSKNETGYVCLNDKRFTHIDALFQCMFHIPAFRKLISTMPVGEEHAGHSAEAFRDLFRQLQCSNESVSAKNVLRALSWDTPSMDHTIPGQLQDFQPCVLLRSICESLEEHCAKKSSIRNLFRGELQTYVECCDITYSSVNNEPFYGLTLRVRADDGSSLLNLTDSLRNFVAEEELEGANAYEVEGHGKQRAKRGTRIKKCPPVLMFEINRSSFDATRMEMVTLSSRLEFPDQLDLSPFQPEAGLYTLHAVAVQSMDRSFKRVEYYHAHIKAPNGKIALPLPDRMKAELDKMLADGETRDSIVAKLPPSLRVAGTTHIDGPMTASMRTDIQGRLANNESKEAILAALDPNPNVRTAADNYIDAVQAPPGFSIIGMVAEIDTMLASGEPKETIIAKFPAEAQEIAKKYMDDIEEASKSRWFTFPDTAVVPCSTHAAMDANFGGSDTKNWNYFERTPAELANATAPQQQRTHSACMLFYIRADDQSLDSIDS